MANDNSNDTVAVYCRVDKETEAILDSMASELNYPKGTIGGFFLRCSTRWFKGAVRKMILAEQEANGKENDG